MGEYYEKSYSPVFFTTNIRIYLGLEVSLKWKIYSIYITNEFNTPIKKYTDKRIYLTLPYKYYDGVE